MWRVILVTLALGACGDNKLTPKDAGADPTADASPIDSGAAVRSCLDRPHEAANPPNGQLPCELISPGFKP
jgi:hypothetical protein